MFGPPRFKKSLFLVANVGSNIERNGLQKLIKKLQFFVRRKREHSWQFSEFHSSSLSIDNDFIQPSESDRSLESSTFIATSVVFSK
jgi:hypothetical protein